jgi:hypothetical protein
LWIALPHTTRSKKRSGACAKRCKLRPIFILKTQTTKRKVLVQRKERAVRFYFKFHLQSPKHIFRYFLGVPLDGSKTSWSFALLGPQWINSHQHNIHWMDAHYYSVVDESQLS